MEGEEGIYRKFIRYELLTPRLTDAWSFIMGHIDEFKTPNIEIVGELGSWDIEDGEMCEPYVKYRTSVAGDVEGGW